MNRTYIKRQLNLKKLGIPMSDDVQEYYDKFNSLIDLNNLKYYKYLDYPNNIIGVDDEFIIFEYSPLGNILFINKRICNIFRKHMLNDEDKSIIIGSILTNELMFYVSKIMLTHDLSKFEDININKLIKHNFISEIQ